MYCVSCVLMPCYTCTADCSVVFISITYTCVLPADSKIIQRMARAAKPDVDSKDQKSDSKETVVLFVRIEGENYCCLGRLQWVAIDLLSRPVKIKWELIDYDVFCDSSHFKRVLVEGGLS